jgi:hypothetical protein
MPRVVTLNDVQVVQVRIQRGAEGGLELNADYVLLAADGRLMPGSTYVMELTGTQRTTLVNFINNQILPAIRLAEGI